MAQAFTLFFRCEASNRCQGVEQLAELHDAVRADEVVLAERIDDFFTENSLNFAILVDVLVSGWTEQKTIKNAETFLKI